MGGGGLKLLKKPSYNIEHCLT